MRPFGGKRHSRAEEALRIPALPVSGWRKDFVYSSFYLFVYLSIRLLSFCLFVYLPFYLFVYFLFVFLSLMVSLAKAKVNIEAVKHMIFRFF